MSLSRPLAPAALACFGACALHLALPGWTSVCAIGLAALLGEISSSTRRWIDSAAVRAMPLLPALGAVAGIGGEIGAATSASIALSAGLAWLLAVSVAEPRRHALVPAFLFGLAAAAAALGSALVGDGRSITPFLLGALAAAGCSASRWNPPAAFERHLDRVGTDGARVTFAVDVVLALAAAIAGGASRSGLVLLASWFLAEAISGALRETGAWSRRLSWLAFLAPAFGAWLVLSALPRTPVGWTIAVCAGQAIAFGAGVLGLQAIAPRAASRGPLARIAFAAGSLAIPGALVAVAMRLEPRLRVEPTDWRPLASGVEVLVRDLEVRDLEVRALEGDGGAPVRAVVVRIDLDSPDVELFATPVAFPRPMDPFELRFVPEVATSEDLVVATNGPLFGGSFGALPLPGLPYRTTEAMVIDGRPVCVTPITYLFWVDAERRLHVDRVKPPPEESLERAVWGVGVQQVHLRDGAIPGYYREGRHERYDLTLIGSDAQGRFLYLSRFDAIDPVVALDFLAGLGVLHAGELDGGSASAIALRGSDGLRVAGGVRPVAVTIGVRSKTPVKNRDLAANAGS